MQQPAERSQNFHATSVFVTAHVMMKHRGCQTFGAVARRAFLVIPRGEPSHSALQWVGLLCEVACSLTTAQG